MTIPQMQRASELAWEVEKKLRESSPGSAPKPALCPQLTGKEREPVREPLGIPVEGPAPALPPLKEIGLGITYGASIDTERAPRYAASERLAAVLNCLSLNDPARPLYYVEIGGKAVSSPEELIEALQGSKHTVVVQSMRYFSNFGKLHYKGREVATPFWIDTEIPVPGTPGKETFKIPAPHSQHELVIRGPQVQAEVCFYLGTDGETRWRSMATVIQRWVGRKVMFEYEGKDAVRAVRLAGAVRRAYVAKKTKHPDLPFGGYFVLGVCNDSNALVEAGMRPGKVTFYPLLRDLSYYKGDDEVDKLARTLPVDGDKPAELERILGALPEADWGKLAFPQLRDQLHRLRPEGH